MSGLVLQPPRHQRRAGRAEQVQGVGRGRRAGRAVRRAGDRARGLSNFRAFTVSDWPEAVEAEPDDEPARAIPLKLPVVANGRIDKPTDVDFYRFSARKGQRVFIDCWAWRIDSQLDGTLMVYDDMGKELGYSGDYAGKDPFLDFTAPADGEYLVKVWDFIYAGSNDHFYRLQIGSVPHLDAVIPAAIRPGEETTLTLLGRNLPGGELVPGPGDPLEAIHRTIQVPAEVGRDAPVQSGEPVRPPQATLDGMAYRLTTPEGSSNPIFLAFDYSDDPGRWSNASRTMHARHPGGAGPVRGHRHVSPGG